VSAPAVSLLFIAPRGHMVIFISSISTSSKVTEILERWVEVEEIKSKGKQEKNEICTEAKLYHEENKLSKKKINKLPNVFVGSILEGRHCGLLHPYRVFMYHKERETISSPLFAYTKAFVWQIMTISQQEYTLAQCYFFLQFNL